MGWSQSKGPQPYLITYISDMLWKGVSQLLWVQQRGLEPYMITFQATITAGQQVFNACEKVNQRAAAQDPLGSMQPKGL